MTPANFPGGAPRQASPIFAMLLLDVSLSVWASILKSNALDEATHLPTGYLYR
jgi:hypothetical protein